MDKRKKRAHRAPKKKLVRRRKSLPTVNFKRELAAGIKVEMEHTKRRWKSKGLCGGNWKLKAKALARKIAMDHLRETPHYYSRLKRCFPEERHNPGSPGRSHMTAPFRVPSQNPKKKSWTTWPMIEGKQIPTRCEMWLKNRDPYNPKQCGKIANYYYGGRWVCDKHGPKRKQKNARNPKSMKNYIPRS